MDGKLLDEIILPVPNVTSCAFGGENLDQLIITSAKKEMAEEEIEKHPLSGSIFVVEPGVTGCPSTSLAVAHEHYRGMSEVGNIDLPAQLQNKGILDMVRISEWANERDRVWNCNITCFPRSSRRREFCSGEKRGHYRIRYPKSLLSDKK